MSKRHKRTPGPRRYERHHDAKLTREPVRPRSADPFEQQYQEPDRTELQRLAVRVLEDPTSDERYLAMMAEAKGLAERVLQDPTSDPWDRASAATFLNSSQAEVVGPRVARR